MPNFEPLYHQNLNGERIVVPLYLNDELELCEDSEVLLRAADIISTQVITEDMSSILDTVRGVLSNSEDNTGTIIEDNLGVGSVTIDSQLTRVTIKNEGIFFTPTNLLFSMLCQWAEYVKES
jgi:hypothetical protein